MEKEILLLATSAKTGKTTTIRMLYNNLIDEYKLDKKKIKNGDFRACIERNGCIIGFCSEGDHESIVRENCNFFRKNNCDICITAVRTRGNTKNMILKFAEKNTYNVSFFDFSSCTNNPDHANTEKARMMLERIKYLIKI